MGGALSLATASQGGHVAWIVPTYKNGRSLWRWASAAAAPLGPHATISKSEREIAFSSGGLFGIYSADNEDSIRGEAFNLVIIDEAARISETAWTDAIQPTLADAEGDAILISTPKGRNWFWLEFQAGLADGKQQASFTAPSAANPSPQIQAAAAMAQTKVPERTYRQEWLAEFVEDGGGVFRFVVQAATAVPQDAPVENHEYLFGVDWARTDDATVFIVLDSTAREAVYIDRMTNTDYNLQRTRLKALYERFRPGAIIAEYNSMGGPQVEQLQSEGLPVQPFTTTNASKAQAIDALALAFEQGSLKIPNDPVLIGELQAYESERLPSGMLRYGAPAGFHDDCVMALAIAYSGLVSVPWLIS